MAGSSKPVASKVFLYEEWLVVVFRRMVILGLCIVKFSALLTAAFAAREDDPLPDWILHFQLTETPESVLRAMGGGASVVHIGRLDLYEFRRSEQDSEEEPDWRFTFRLPERRLVVVTRNYEKAIDVRNLFPEGESELKLYPDKEKPALRLLVRKLDSRRLLLARLESGSRNMADQLVLASPPVAGLMFPFLAKGSADTATRSRTDPTPESNMGVLPIRWDRLRLAPTYVRTEEGVSNFWRQPINGDPAEQITKFTSGLIWRDARRV